MKLQHILELLDDFTPPVPTHVTGTDRVIHRHEPQLDHEKAERGYFLRVVWPSICRDEAETAPDATETAQDAS